MPVNSCTQVDDNIWVQAHDLGENYDVYFNENCRDAQGEFCDNVAPSFGNSGEFNSLSGSATICPAGKNKKVYASRDDEGNLSVRVETFEVE